MLRGCRPGVHDISRSGFDAANNLPLFNTPFELGLFLGAARFGAALDQRRKACLLLDRVRYRFPKFLSDIAGQDIRERGDDPERAIGALRAWLAALPRRDMLPAGTAITARDRRFRAEVPAVLAAAGVRPDAMVFADYANLVFRMAVRTAADGGLAAVG